MPVQDREYYWVQAVHNSIDGYVMDNKAANRIAGM